MPLAQINKIIKMLNLWQLLNKGGTKYEQAQGSDGCVEISCGAHIIKNSYGQG